MPWRLQPTKDAASCEKLRRDASGHRPGDLRMGQPVRLWPDTPLYCGGEPGEVKHLSSPRSRNRRDSPSSGERTGNSLNRSDAKTAVVVGLGVAGSSVVPPQRCMQVINRTHSRIVLGKRAVEGESPVGEVCSACSDDTRVGRSTWNSG